MGCCGGKTASALRTQAPKPIKATPSVIPQPRTLQRIAKSQAPQVRKPLVVAQSVGGKYVCPACRTPLIDVLTGRDKKRRRKCMRCGQTYA